MSSGDAPRGQGRCALLGGGGLRIFVAPSLLVGAVTVVDLPRVVHHELEVLVVVDGSRDVVVVLFELLLGHDVVGRVVVAQVVVRFECLKELKQDLLLGLLAREHVRVCLSRVDALDVVDVDPPVAVLVQLSEGLRHQSLAAGVHGSAELAEELVVVDGAGAVDIEVGVECADLRVGEAEHVVLHGLGELVEVQRSAVVVVHNAELLPEPDDAAGAS